MAFDALMIVLLVLGFGFVIFFHELGHFLAAKWVGIKVEQFAVGFGQALFAWRKGIGFRVGTTHAGISTSGSTNISPANDKCSFSSSEKLEPSDTRSH